MRELGLLLTLLLGGFVHAAPLQLVFPAKSTLRSPVDVTFKIEGEVLIARFATRVKNLYVKKQFEAGDYPYKFDVVELFLAVGDEVYPYYEFELTPLGQTLQVKIESARKFTNGIELGLQVRNQITPGGWIAEMKIPLRSLGWDGDVDKLKGNAFAILGQGKSARSYWSLSLPKQTRPNFHQPQFFRALDIIR